MDLAATSSVVSSAFATLHPGLACIKGIEALAKCVDDIGHLEIPVSIRGRWMQHGRLPAVYFTKAVLEYHHEGIETIHNSSQRAAGNAYLVAGGSQTVVDRRRHQDADLAGVTADAIQLVLVAAPAKVIEVVAFTDETRTLIGVVDVTVECRNDHAPVDAKAIKVA